MKWSHYKMIKKELSQVKDVRGVYDKLLDYILARQQDEKINIKEIHFVVTDENTLEFRDIHSDCDHW